MTLAQEKAFKSGTPFKRRMSYDIPTRNPARAKEAVGRIRRQYDKMNPDEQSQTKQLLREAWKVQLHLVKDKRHLTTREREDIWKIALMYTALKNELGRKMKK